jgi:hypothetical protein
MVDWTPEERLAFDIGFALKKSNRIKRARDEDPFPSLARHILEQLRLSGWRFEHANTGGELEPGTVSLETYRADRADARAALRMIREALEAHCLPGTLPAEENVEPPLTAEAAVLVRAITALAKLRKTAS